MENVEQKPGWWTIYIIYCLTPVLIYIWYLYKRCKEVKSQPKCRLACRLFAKHYIKYRNRDLLEPF